MENNIKEKSGLNIWAMLAAFLFGAVLGFIIAPVKKGMIIGNHNTVNKDSDSGDFCDYDYDEYYDDDLSFRDDADNALDDETESYSF